MTRIKKGILTLVSLSLVLIYCLINDPSRDITLTLGLYAGSSWDVPNGESYQVIDQAIKKFEKKYPNVHVEYKSGIIKDDYSSWLANEITKGTIPDVFMVLPDDFNTLSSIGILKNLDRLIKEERIDTSLFYQSALFAGNNGSQYALPYEINPTIMCINHDLLTKEGIAIPSSNWTIDDFYKTVGYACLYKGYGERVDAVPINELTVSIFRATRPEKMFLTLQRYGHKIEERYPGIYYVTEYLPIPAQIIVTQELEPGEHRSLKILSNHAKKEDVEEFLRKAEGMNTPRDRQNVEAVLQVSVRANDELYREIRRDANMCDALRELMKDDLEDARKLGESEGKAMGEVVGEAKIILKMNHSGMSPENIASITGKDLDEINAILEGKVSALL